MSKSTPKNMIKVIDAMKHFNGQYARWRSTSFKNREYEDGVVVVMANLHSALEEFFSQKD